MFENLCGTFVFTVIKNAHKRQDRADHGGRTQDSFNMVIQEFNQHFRPNIRKAKLSRFLIARCITFSQ